MRIFNGTQHEICFFHIEDTTPIEQGRKLLLNEGAKPYFVVEPGKNLNCRKGNAPPPEIKDSPVPIVGAVIFLDADPLPEGEYDIYIVSNLYRSACAELGRDTSQLATVSGTVYEPGPNQYKPCGCTELAVG